MSVSLRSRQALQGGFTSRRAHELIGTVIDMAAHTATDNGAYEIAACVMTPAYGPGVVVASGLMDGVKPASVATAANKCSTCLTWDCNTNDLARYSVTDVLAAQASHPYFCPWDGGIRVYGSNGLLLCVLAVSGRSALGDRILAVKGAHSLGYVTDFDENGLSPNEAAES